MNSSYMQSKFKNSIRPDSARKEELRGKRADTLSKEVALGGLIRD